MTGPRLLWNPAAECLSRDELQAFQWRKLTVQLAYNYANSLFYRRRFDRIGCRPEDIRTWDDFRKLPIMNKHDHRQAQEESVERHGHPFGMLAGAPPEKFIILNATSNTTGVPTLYTITARDLAIASSVLFEAGLQLRHLRPTQVRPVLDHELQRRRHTGARLIQQDPRYLIFYASSVYEMNLVWAGSSS